MKRLVTIATLTVAILAVLPAPSLAQKTVRATGYGFMDTPPDVEVMVTTVGDSLVFQRYYFFIEPEDDEWPTSTAYCASVMLVRGGETLHASGSCLRSDADGDHMSGVWWRPENEGMTGGRVRYVNGTGKYEGLTCEGTSRRMSPHLVAPGRWVNTSELTCRQDSGTPESLAGRQTIHTTEFGFSGSLADIKRTVTAVGDSINVVRSFNHQISDSPDWPHAAEICVVTALVRNGRGVISSGSCIRTDVDGDQTNGLFWYSDKEGQPRGVYRPGTGKYAGMRCEGVFKGGGAVGVAGFSTVNGELKCSRN